MSNLYVCNYTFRACVSLSLWILMSILHIQTYVESYLRMGVLLIYIDVPPSINPIAPLNSLNYWVESCGNVFTCGSLSCGNMDMIR